MPRPNRPIQVYKSTLNELKNKVKNGNQCIVEQNVSYKH